MSSRVTAEKALAFGAGAAAGAFMAWKLATRPYKPDKVWAPPSGGSGGKWASINRETSGAREDRPLPEGSHPIQLYSLATPNGVKVTLLLEELCDLLPDLDYDVPAVGA